MSVEAFHACSRFGLGASAPDMAAAGYDPRGWLRSQLDSPYMPKEVAGFTGNSEATQKFIAHFRAKKNMKAMADLKQMRDVYIRQTGERFLAQVRSTQPFFERLVLFWSNHFTVSAAQKPVIAGLVNMFEVEAIRPHVLGRFSDMLRAVVQHPAMLMYLDNVQSFGPSTRFSKRRGKGLNENLAREILELHTLGVNGGYSQKDVIELAKILTGWTFRRDLDGTIMPEFKFQARVHEPGERVLLGKRYNAEDERDGLAALDDLALHPATANHIATKLACHFIADEPSANTVSYLASVFLSTRGDMKAMARALVDMPESWNTPLAKFKNHYEYALAASRATGHEPAAEKVVFSLEALNFRAFGANSPAGFEDTASYWSSPDAIMKRLEWAQALSRKVKRDINAMPLAEATIGPVMKPDTRFAISGAPSREDGIALVLVSPEFQRR